MAFAHDSIAIPDTDLRASIKNSFLHFYGTGSTHSSARRSASLTQLKDRARLVPQSTPESEAPFSFLNLTPEACSRRGGPRTSRRTQRFGTTALGTPTSAADLSAAAPACDVRGNSNEDGSSSSCRQDWGQIGTHPLLPGQMVAATTSTLLESPAATPNATPKILDLASALGLGKEAEFKLEVPLNNGGGERSNGPKPSASLDQGRGEREPKEAGGRPTQKKKQNASALSTNLKKLESADPRSVFQVRNLNALGFAAYDILHRQFGAYGVVEEVLLANVHDKSLAPGRRKRPSGMGFVKMCHVEDAQKILSQEFHAVMGTLIRVLPFEHNPKSIRGRASKDVVDGGDGQEDGCASPSSTPTAA